MPNYGKYSCLCEYILKECIANVNTKSYILGV